MRAYEILVSRYNLVNPVATRQLRPIDTLVTIMKLLETRISIIVFRIKHESMPNQEDVNRYISAFCFVLRAFNPENKSHRCQIDEDTPSCMEGNAPRNCPSFSI
jgi:hypothetical protein